MNEVLKNIWNHLTAKELTKSSFEDWVANVSADEKIQSNIHGYLSKNNLTSSDFETWKANSGLKKKDDSEAISTEEPVVSAIPTQEEPGLLASSQEQTLDNKIVIEEQPQPDKPLAGKTVEDFELAGVERPEIDEAKVLQSAGIDQTEFDAWRKRTAREEGWSYSPFSNDRSMPVYGEDPDVFYGNREREQMKFIQSYKTKQINEIQSEIEQKQKTLSDPNISTYEQQRLSGEVQMLQSRLSQEYRNFKNIEKNFPNYMKMKSERALKEKEFIERYREGGSEAFMAGAEQVVGQIGKAIVDQPKKILSTVAEFLDGTLSAVGFDKKGFLAALSEDLTRSMEQELEQSDLIERPAFIQGKEVVVDGIKYVVNDQGVVYDEQTLVAVNELMPENEIQSIVKKAEEVEEEEVYTDLSAGLGAMGSTLANLMGLIRGGNILQKSLGVGPKLGVGIWSTAQAMGEEINTLTEELIASGVGEKEATGKARVYGGLTATLDGVWTGITGANDKLVPKKQAIKELLYDLVEKDGKKFTNQQLLKKGKELINENFKELVEEFGVLYSTKAINSLMNADLGQEIRNVDYANKADIMETLVMTLGATNALGTSRVFTNNDRNKMIRYVANNIEDVDATVKSLVEEGLISVKDGKIVADEVKKVRQAELKVAGAIKETENMLTAADLIDTKERLVQIREKQDPSLREDTDKKIASIDAQLKLLQEKDKKDVQDAIQKQKTRDISDAQPAEAVQEVEEEVRVSPEEKVETVGDLINRPVTLTKLGGSTLDAPIEGDMYLDGQQVVVEDADGNITEIGNVDEVSGQTLEQIGIEQQMPEVKTTEDGNIEFQGTEYNPDSAVIRRDSRGNITSVSIDQVGKPRQKTFRGKNAEDVAYNVLLRQAQASQDIEQKLEQDEEFQNELRQVEAAPQTEADQDTRPPVTERTKLQGLIDNAKKAISKLGLNVEIVFPETEQEYKNLTNEQDRSRDQVSGGKYVGGKIYINPAAANARTVAHEVFHALLLSRGMSDAQARAITERMLNSVKKVADGDLLERLEQFSQQYDDALQSEESIAELFGILAEGYPELPKPTQNIIKRWLDKLAKILGLKPFTDAEVIDLLNTVSGKVARGEQISESDIEMFGDVGKRPAKAERKQKTGKDVKAKKQRPGNRLFNEPLKGVKKIADGYYKRVFKSERPIFEGTRELDTERSKRISDAFEAMEYKPNDPEVKAAYEALSKETLGQYQAFLDAGYTVEIDNVDAYGNSQEMIDDLRQNKRIKIFSTEAGFGKDPITDKQRQENPLLRDSGFKDVNGESMLVNDVFRAIHDFFGHAELGNSFGAKGEENAWNVHSRMFSPLARKAMTTETRGQNSYVNFSGVNQKVEALRDKARTLRDQGKEAEAQKIVDEIYALTAFADQKIGLLPEEFSAIKPIGKVEPVKTDAKGNLKKPSQQSRKNLVSREQKIVKDVKDQVKPGKTVSTSLPKESDIHSSNNYIVSMSSLEKMAQTDNAAMNQYMKIANEVLSYGITKTKTINSFNDAKKVLAESTIIIKKNLKWLYDSVSPEVRAISKLWYDGANKISNELASRYDYSVEQVSGVMAVLSPQMDWFRNLSLGERVIDIYTNNQNTVFDDKMIDFVKNATTGTGKNKKPLFKDRDSLAKRLKGKKLSQLSKKDQAIFIRTYDEVYNPREYNNITPNGEINGLVRVKSGLPGKAGWGDFSTIEKAISVLDNGSLENISKNLGNQHKVRNFFNNISNPNDKNAVTIDTHAVAAALLKPLSGKSKQVAYNFGGSSSVSTGMTGTYPLYADAYRSLANDLKILAREVQSITWEAGRGLFKATFKSQKSNEEKINNVWDRYSSGKIPLSQAQANINSLAGGVSKPVWYEYLADQNSESMDQNSAAMNQAVLDKEAVVSEPEQVSREQKQMKNRPKTKVDKLREDSEKKLKKMRKKKESIFLRARKKFLDRQAFIKRALKGISGKQALKAARMMVVRAGAKGFAKVRYKEAEKKIFDGLNKDELGFLESLIYSRRIIAINENRAARGMEPYFGKDRYSEEDARKNLEELKESIPEKQFNKINARADKYFGVFEENLKRLYDSGRISKEVYDQLKDVEYTPIRTLKYLNLSENELDAEIGMSAADIKALSNENENDILFDAKWNLMTTINAVEAKAFENKMLKAFNKAFEGATEAEKEAMSEYMKDNPVIGKNKDGTNKRKFKKAEAGFVKVFFYENGIKDYMIIREDMANELLDIKQREKSLERIGQLSGAKVLRFFATGGNPLFIIGNTAVDFANILFLSDVYSGFKPLGAAQLAWDFTKNFLKATTKAGNYDQIYREFMEYGAGMDYLSQEGLEALRTPWKEAFNPARKALLWIGEGMSYMGQSSEIAFRIAVYEKTKSNLIKKYKKENGKAPVGENLEDIKYEAARESRETIDFSQGGTLAKKADIVLPYFNAGLQGYRKMVDYANKNPIGFASSMIQYAAMAGSLFAYSLANLLTRLKDDDDEDKLNDVLNSVSPYEKSAYHIIFTGNKDKNGEYEYVRIKKLPGTGFIATIAEQMILGTVNKDYKVDNKTLTNSFRQGLPFDPEGLFSRNPVISAVVAYRLNYDMFRKQEIFRKPSNKIIEPYAEGLYDDRVAGLYKAVGKAFNISPKRSQAFMEKFITSESTNPFVSLLYAATEGLYEDDTSFGKEMKSATSKFMNNVSRKLQRTTNKKLLQYNENDELKKIEAKLDTDKYVKERKVYKEISSIIKSGKKVTQKQLYDLVVNNFDRVDYKKYFKKYYLYATYPDTDTRVLDLIYEDNPEVQAEKLYARYGDSFDKEESIELGKALRRAGRKGLGKKTMYYYGLKIRK